MDTSLVEIRVAKQDDRDKSWENLPIVGYLPSFLSPDLARANIEKRLRQLYLDKDPEIDRIYWQFRGQTNPGHWITRS